MAALERLVKTVESLKLYNTPGASTSGQDNQMRYITHCFNMPYLRISIDIRNIVIVRLSITYVFNERNELQYTIFIFQQKRENVSLLERDRDSVLLQSCHQSQPGVQQVPQHVHGNVLCSLGRPGLR